MFMEGHEITLDHHSTNPTRDRKDSTKSFPSDATVKKLSSVDGLSSGSSLQQENFATARNFSPRLSRKMDGTTNASRKVPVTPIDLDGALDMNASCSELDSSLTKGLPGPPFICKHTVDDISAQISWMAPFSRQPVSFYQLVVQEVDVNSTDTATEKLSPWLLQIASTSVELRNLTPNVEYLVRVRAVNTAGAGEWCKPYKFKGTKRNVASAKLKHFAEEQRVISFGKSLFQRWRLYPWMLRDVSVVDLSTSIFGQKISMPICVGATAMQRMAHVDGETATARACRSVGTGMMLSSWATSTIEEVAQAAPDGLHWLQLYIYKDREVTRSLVQRAERAGYKGIFVTVDTPFLGKRFDDVRNRFQLPPHLRMKNFDTNDLAFSSEKGYGENSGLAVYVAQAIDPSIKWEDIQWLRGLTSLPIVAKGILRADDAREAVKSGVNGILVSNHGARQLDGVPATIDVLPEIVEAVEGKVEVFLDGGVRKGTDVLKALALGARAVFIGRPIIWGLVYQGEEGAKEVLQMLKEEFQLAMALSGCRSVKEINRTLVQRTSAVAKI